MIFIKRFVLVFIFSFLTIINVSFAQTWWDSNWNYRVPVIINNPHNILLTEYQVNFNITYDSKMQKDFSDLIFTWFNKTNNTEIKIPYWIEKMVNGNWAYVWIKVPEIFANTNTSIYMYYGNPSATTESNRAETMEFVSVWKWTSDLTSYDDFISSFVVDNESYVLAGEKNSGSNGDAFAVKKMNLSGNEIWTYEKDTGSCGSGSEELFDITIGENGNYAIVGEACAPNEGQYYFAKISPYGQLICEWTQEVGYADELWNVVFDKEKNRYIAIGRESTTSVVFVNITPSCFLDKKIIWSDGTYPHGKDIIIDGNDYVISSAYYSTHYRFYLEKRRSDFSRVWLYQDLINSKDFNAYKAGTIVKIDNNYFSGGSEQTNNNKFLFSISPSGSLQFNKTIHNDLGTLRGGDNAWLDGEAVFAGDRGFYLVLLNSTGDVIQKYNASLNYSADAVDVKKDFYKHCYILAGNDRKNGNGEWRIERICERKLVIAEPTVTLGLEESGDYVISSYAPQSIEPNKNFSFAVIVRNATNNNPITNLVATDFSMWKEGEQIGFGFTNLGNGSYSLLINSGNLLDNISFRVCAKNACEEKSVKISVMLKDRTAFIASEWLAAINSGLLGKPLFRNYSDTAKYFLGRQQPEQVFTFDNITTEFQTYRIKDIDAIMNFFEGAILVKTKEQALAAAPLAKLKNYGILFEGSRYSRTILNLTDRTSEQINDLVIKEARAQGKNINTIIIANQNSKNSELVGLAAVKYDSIIIPLNFPQPNYPVSVSNFYQVNLDNGVIAAMGKINQTAKKLNSNGFFANNWDYKLGKQINLILIGNKTEMPHGIVFDTGNEWFGDTDGNNILTDYLYSDLNRDGKADLMTGRIISEYQLLSSKKEKKIVTAALYRNLEFAYSGNGLIESMSTDTAFRTAGFSAVRLIENHTSLSYFNISLPSIVAAIGDFLKKLFGTESITDSLALLFKVYGTYEEFLEHNLYKMMNTIEFSWSEGLIFHFFPDEKLEKERLKEEMRSAEGIFYYGVGNESAWFLPDENNNYKIAFDFGEFPILNLPFIYNEYDKAMRGRIEKIFEKGAAAIAGPTGIVHGAHAFAFNSKFAQSLARNKTAAKSVDNAKFLTQQETKNLTQIISFGQTAWSQLSIKQFLQTVLYAEPEYKIDPNYTEYEQNPEVLYNGSFVAKIKVPFNYSVIELNGTKLILFDAEQWLQEFYKPVIPVYTKEFLLPNGSQVLRIEVNYTTQGYTNVFVPIAMPDEYYQQENRTQQGFYPDKNFENQSFELLDGRKSLLLTAMPLRYNNQTKEALVFSDIEFIILYTSPLDILDFSAKNITLGEQQKFFIKLKNIGDQKNITIAIEVSGETIFESNEIGANEEKSFSISWKPKETGYYVAKAFVLFENNSAGPRYASFSVAKRNVLETMGILPSRIFEETSAIKTQKIYRTALEKLSISKEADGMLIEYSAPGTKFLSKINATASEKIMTKNGYKLETLQENSVMIQKITEPEGYFSIEKNLGAIKEKCKGDCENLKSKLASAIAEMNSLINELQEKIK